MGYILLAIAVENAGNGLYGPGFRAFAAGWATGNPIGWYRAFLEAAVLPNWQTGKVIRWYRQHKRSSVEADASSARVLFLRRAGSHARISGVKEHRR